MTIDICSSLEILIITKDIGQLFPVVETALTTCFLVVSFFNELFNLKNISFSKAVIFEFHSRRSV
jgi:hypothetical protein